MGGHWRVYTGTEMADTQLIPRHSKDGRVEVISGDTSHYLLSIPSGKADRYRLAQLDDYTQLTRGKFPLHFPVSLSLSARTASASIPGTWGFGLWNDPFGLSLGLGGNPFRLPALPNAAWFFGASEENYLSFKAPRAPEEHQDYRERSDEARSRSTDEAQRSSAARASSAPPKNDGSAQGEIAANGFLAQTFRSPSFHPRLIAAGLALPFSRTKTREMLSKVIEEDGIQLWSSAPGLQKVDPTLWHRYRLNWRAERVAFEVDDVLVFESPVSPHPPLGLVIWIDNQYAAFTPEGKIGFGVLENPEPAWLEVKDIEIMQG